jgi:hypothetical protein
VDEIDLEQLDGAANAQMRTFSRRSSATMAHISRWTKRKKKLEARKLQNPNLSSDTMLDK